MISGIVVNMDAIKVDVYASVCTEVCVQSQGSRTGMSADVRISGCQAGPTSGYISFLDFISYSCSYSGHITKTGTKRRLLKVLTYLALFL